MTIYFNHGPGSTDDALVDCDWTPIVGLLCYQLSDPKSEAEQDSFIEELKVLLSALACRLLWTGRLPASKVGMWTP